MNMKQFLYLGHQTTLNNLDKILDSDYLYTSYERKKLNVKYEGLLSMANYTNFENKEIPMKHFKGEFPGVYMNYYPLNAYRCFNTYSLGMQYSWMWHLCHITSF